MLRITKDEALARATEEAGGAPRCEMCVLAGAGARGLALRETANAVAVLSRYAVRRGHVLVVLRDHREAIDELPAEDWLALSRLAWEATRALAAVLSPVRTYVAALGTVTQRANSFPHVHQHVVPLFDGGTSDRPAEVFTWQGGVLCYEPGEAEALTAQLRARWPA